MPFRYAFLYDVKKSPAYELSYLIAIYWACMACGINVNKLNFINSHFNDFLSIFLDYCGYIFYY